VILLQQFLPVCQHHRPALPLQGLPDNHGNHQRLPRSCWQDHQRILVSVPNALPDSVHSLLLIISWYEFQCAYSHKKGPQPKLEAMNQPDCLPRDIIRTAATCVRLNPEDHPLVRCSTTHGMKVFDIVVDFAVILARRDRHFQLSIH